MSVKHTVENEAAEERTHPTFFPLLEQWEQHAQAIQRLRVGEAFVRLPTDTVHRVRTPTLPRITVAPERLAAVREHYLHAYFRPCQGMGQPSGESPIPTSVPSPVPAAVTTLEPPLIRRYHSDEPPGQPRQAV